MEELQNPTLRNKALVFLNTNEVNEIDDTKTELTT